MLDARNPRLRAALLLALVGGIGFVAGIVADRLVLLRSTEAVAAGPEAREPSMVAIIRGSATDTPSPGRRVVRLGLPEQLADELDLAPAQRAEVERILAEDQAALREVMEEIQPSLTAIIERSRQRIYEVLTDEQIERWEESAVLRLRRGDGRIIRE